VACNVYFGAAGDARVFIRLDEDAEAVVARLRDSVDGWERFMREGKPVFVNARNVWWVGDETPEQGAGYF
jgi:hypothetical protein